MEAPGVGLIIAQYLVRRSRAAFYKGWPKQQWHVHHLTRRIPATCFSSGVMLLCCRLQLDIVRPKILKTFGGFLFTRLYHQALFPRTVLYSDTSPKLLFPNILNAVKIMIIIILSKFNWRCDVVFSKNTCFSTLLLIKNNILKIMKFG